MVDLGPYEIDNIYCGECSEMMKKLPDECIDLTVTSPPYDSLRDYKGYVFPFEQIARQLWRVTSKGGVVVWVVGDATIDGSETGTSFRQALYFMECGFKLHDTMIYAKEASSFPESNRYYPIFEYMFVFSKEKPKTFNPISDIENSLQGKKRKSRMERQPSGKIRRPNRKRDVKRKSVRPNIWYYGQGYMKHTKDKLAFRHPAIFPEALARDHIISWSNPGDLVFDPMIGSGTVAKMAIETDHHYLGFDISQEYVDLAKQRIKSARIPLPGLIEGLNAKN